MGKQIVYAEGSVVVEGIEVAETPWKPAHTAPKDGSPFIAFDDAIKSAETVRWFAEKGMFVNDENKQAQFTRWIRQPD